ncbi:hypothetical protein BX600DRAFT_102439 [Xylariales sp. PMI_506]|nr:hypothetical protein BX600DRAFT_102439 [Xylariales sp. PMI_506]
MSSQRKGGPRSRSGCGSCKARHVKCDETRPSCRRCVATGRSCPGYPVTAQDAKSSSTALSLPHDIVAYAIPFRVPGSRSERQLLHYFCVQGAPGLSGNLSSDFWNRLILQRSHDQIAVRQAALALSSAHRRFMILEDESEASEVLANESDLLYNKALRSLRKYLSAGIDNKIVLSPVIPLICSILFYVFESTRGNVPAALQHLRSGITILTRCAEEATAESNATLGGDVERDDMAVLEMVLFRLDIQATMFDDSRLPLMAWNSKSYASGKHQQEPALGFDCLEDAHSALIRIQNRLGRFLIVNVKYKFHSEAQLPQSIKQEKEEILGAFEKWNLRFAQLEHQQYQAKSQSQDNESPGEFWSPQTSWVELSQAAAIIRIHYLTYYLLLESSFPQDPGVFNAAPGSKHQHAVETILDLSQLIVGGTAGQDTGQARQRALTAEAGIVAPLFLLVMKCRDATVTTRALNLLAASKRREGLYDATVVVGIAQSIMHKAAHDESVAQDERVIKHGNALEHLAGDDLDYREGGMDGVARNLGVVL